MSDRIAIFERGAVAQIASPQELYEQPASVFVAGFIGENNILSGRSEGTDDSGRGRVLLDCGRTVRMRAADGFAEAGRPLKIAVRPEHLVVGSAARDRLNQCEGKIADTTYLGDHLRALVDIGGGQTMVVRKPLLDFARPPVIGEEILIGWNEGDGRVFA